jgi:hypothetical protein
LETGRIRESLVGPGGQAGDVAFHAGHRWLVVSFDNGPFQGWILWDTANLDSPTMHPTEQVAKGLAIRPSTRQVAWTEGTQLRLMDVSSNELRVDLNLPFVPFKLHFSPNGNWLAATRNENIVICDPDSGRIVLQLSHENGVNPKVHVGSCVGLDNEGRAIASARVEPQKSNRLESLIRVAADGKSYEELIGGLDDCYFMKLSPDQRFLAITPFQPVANLPGKDFPLMIGTLPPPNW